MHHQWRVEFVRAALPLSPNPITTILYVLAPSRGDVERLALEAFHQCYHVAADKAGFTLTSVWDAE